MGVILGIDIGGSGIKGAPIDISSGRLTEERIRIRTPHPAEPGPVAEAIVQIVAVFDTEGPIGCAFPAVVVDGIVHTAANVDASWIGVDAGDLFGRATGRPFVLLNDADAAGLAEMNWGAGRGNDGVVIVLTFGTGIGSALFVEGHLVPSTELGHLEFRGHDAERYAAAAIRNELDLTFDEWGDRVRDYLAYLDRLFAPDLFIIGGGVSKRFAKFKDRLVLRPEVVQAQLRNEAGMAGAALVASEAGA